MHVLSTRRRVERETTVGFLDKLPLLSRFSPNRPRQRRAFVHEGRAHIEYRTITPEQLGAFERSLERVRERYFQVRWIEVNAQVHRVIIAFARGAYSVDELCSLVEMAEEEAQIAEAPLPVRSSHPIDDESTSRTQYVMLADAVGFGLGMALRLSPLPPLGAGMNASAVLTVIGGVPRLRRVVEESLGEPLTEHLLHVLQPLVQGLAQRTLGSVVDLGYRTALLGEQRARHRAFEARADDLFATPTGGVPPAPPPSRRTLPKGPIEKYAESAWMVSLGAFLVSLAASRSAQSATASLLVGLPKSARLGRETFAAHLGETLAKRGSIALDPGALRRLDRVDCVVIPTPLLGEEGADAPLWLETLLGAARDAELKLILAAEDPQAYSGRGADGVVLGGAALADSVRRLQHEGRVVLLADRVRSPALPLADVGVGLFAAGQPAPWGAHVLARDDLGEVQLLIAACAVARKASSQSVSFAIAAAGLGSFVSGGGFLLHARRVMRVVNVASLVSMVNGLRLSFELSRTPMSPPRDPTPWHAFSPEEAKRRLGATDEGLAERDVLARRRPVASPPSPLVELGEAVTSELMNPLTPLLAAGAGLSAVVGSLDDAALVASVVGLNALVGGVQKFNTERALKRLERHEVVRATVLRRGTPVRMPATELVRGDVVLLEAGDVVPADCRVLEADALEVDASSFTGESLPVPKGPAPSASKQLAERASMLYEGTSIAAGTARALIVAVGDDTEARRAAAAAGTAPTRGGVEARLEKLTSLTAPIAGGAGLALVTLGLLRGRSIDEVVGAGVSMAVAAVPEGLPLLATAAQLAAAKRLGKRGAFVRDPRSLEALGRVNVICMDKTGTVTEGRLRMLTVSDGTQDADASSLTPALRGVVAAALRACAEPRPGHLPDAMDEALAHGAARAGTTARDGADGFRAGAELPFEARRRMHAVLAFFDGGTVLTAKGAPEIIVERSSDHVAEGVVSPLGDADREALLAHAHALGGQGLRVLAVAERRMPGGTIPVGKKLTEDEVGGLTFLGFVAFRDPVRPTARHLVAQLRLAGVRVVMVTGDHPSTAQAIASELGMLDAGGVLTGAELERLTDEELAARVSTTSVVARTTPSHKVRIVRALQRAGRTVAMAGDGANDAPAIRLADVGIALGERATPAARASADIVLLDERIETLVHAIAEGRAMWSAVRDAVSILIGGNLGEIGFTLGAGLFDGRPPLNARQLLVVNLLTDVAPAMAIALRAPAEQSLAALAMEGPDASLGRGLYRDIALRSALTAAGAGGAWFFGRVTGSAARARTIGMVALVGSQLGQTLAAGGGSAPVLWTCLGSAAVLGGIVQTPGVSQFFGCTPLGPVGWVTALTASAAATGVAVLIPRATRAEWRVATDVVVAKPDVPATLQPDRTVCRRGAGVRPSAGHANRSPRHRARRRPALVRLRPGALGAQ